MAIPADLTRKHAIVIDDAYVGTGGVSNFSVLLTRAHFDDEVVDPSGLHEARSDGGDIRFSSDSAGVTHLACDVIAFEHDSSTGAGDAVIQVVVLVPSIAGPTAGDTTIYVWYHGSTTTAQPAANDTYGSDNAYDAYWKGYWPQASVTDRTVNNTDLTAAGSPGTAAGKVGTAWDLDGATQYFTAPTPITATPLTLIAWVNPANETAVMHALGIFSNALGTVNGWGLRLTGNAGGDPIQAITTEANSTAIASISPGFDPSTWYCVAGIWGGASSRFAYSNGTLSSEETTTKTPSAANIVTIGCRYNDAANSYGDFLDGLLEMPSIHSTNRSEAWLDTFYNATNSPALFAAPGTPEDVGGGTTAELAASIEGEGDVAGAATGTAGAAATVEGEGDATGQVSGIAGAAATVEGEGDVSGQPSGIAGASASIEVEGDVTGQPSGIASGAATIEGEADLTGAPTATTIADIAATIDGEGDLTGTATAAAIDTQVPLVLETTIADSLVLHIPIRQRMHLNTTIHDALTLETRL